MELILENPNRLTPKMLFELYTHPDNLVRTLAQGYLTNLISTAKKIISEKKRKQLIKNLKSKGEYGWMDYLKNKIKSNVPFESRIGFII